MTILTIYLADLHFTHLLKVLDIRLDVSTMYLSVWR